MEVIFILEDDNVLNVCPMSSDLNGSYEGIDVANDGYRFFDRNGAPLIAMFDEPNERGTTLGVINWVSSGKYHLVPDETNKGRNLVELLDSISGLEENPYFKSLSEVHKFISTA